MEPQKQLSLCFGLLIRANEKISNRSAQLLGPVVFRFGKKEPAWDLTTADLLQFPEGSLGKTLGESLKKARLEPLAGAESHDVYHILFDFSTSLKDEAAIQFFLRGNGKHSIASMGVSIGAWCVFPGQWSYFRKAYRRGKTCRDISRIDVRALLHEDLTKIKLSLFEKD